MIMLGGIGATNGIMEKFEERGRGGHGLREQLQSGPEPGGGVMQSRGAETPAAHHLGRADRAARSVDADGIARRYTEIQKGTMNRAGIPASPAVMPTNVQHAGVPDDFRRLDGENEKGGRGRVVGGAASRRVFRSRGDRAARGHRAELSREGNHDW